MHKRYHHRGHLYEGLIFLGIWALVASLLLPFAVRIFQDRGWSALALAAVIFVGMPLVMILVARVLNWFSERRFR